MSAEKKKGKLVQLSFVEDFVLSGTAAVTSKTIAAPIERVKMIVQNQEEMIRRGTLSGPLSSVGAFNWIRTNEGTAALWKSNFTNCLRYFPTQALNFAFKGQVKKLEFCRSDKKDSYLVSTSKNIAAGGIAGTGSLTFVYSLDYARTRLANDLKSTKKGGGERQYSGLIDVYKQTLATDGPVGLYRGFVISAVGIFVYRGLYFGLYDSIMPLFPKESVSLPLRFAVGYGVTVLAGLASYPIDTIRRRMMMTSGNKELQYKSSIDCGVQIVNKEGIKSLFKGAGANILRGVAGAGVLAGFDTVVDLYVTFKYGEGSYANIQVSG